MKLGYDNLDDARTKLAGTYCLYKGKALTVKQVDQFPDNGTKFLAWGPNMFNGRNVQFEVEDPDFNCSDYNIGYVNMNCCSVWFYRVPAKQWRQGLRYDQCKAKYTNKEYAQMVSLKACKQVAEMLENKYPIFNNAKDLVVSGDVAVMAFHKDFALSRDRIHQDWLIEYKGTTIGFMDGKRSTKLMDEHEHLTEALREVIG